MNKKTKIIIGILSLSLFSSLLFNLWQRDELREWRTAKSIVGTYRISHLLGPYFAFFSDSTYVQYISGQNPTEEGTYTLHENGVCVLHPKGTTKLEESRSILLIKDTVYEYVETGFSIYNKITDHPVTIGPPE